MIISFNNIQTCSLSQYDHILPIKKSLNYIISVNYYTKKTPFHYNTENIEEKKVSLQYKPDNINSYISNKIYELIYDRIVQYDELSNYIKTIPYYELNILFINEIMLQRLKDLGLHDIINGQKNLTFIIVDKIECDTITCIRNDSNDFLFVYHENNRYYDLIELNGFRYHKLLLK